MSFTDAGGSSVNRSVAGTQVVKHNGKPALPLSPGRIDPANPVWNASRKPLVGEFSFDGKNVFVIANHFDAKLGDQNQDGRYQYPAQSSAVPPELGVREPGVRPRSPGSGHQPRNACPL